MPPRTYSASSWRCFPPALLDTAARHVRTGTYRCPRRHMVPAGDPHLAADRARQPCGSGLHPKALAFERDDPVKIAESTRAIGRAEVSGTCRWTWSPVWQRLSLLPRQHGLHEAIEQSIHDEYAKKIRAAQMIAARRRNHANESPNHCKLAMRQRRGDKLPRSRGTCASPHWRRPAQTARSGRH